MEIQVTKVLQQFAASNNLNLRFEPGFFEEKPIIEGEFNGHFLSIHYESEKDYHGITIPAYTVFELKRNQKSYNMKRCQTYRDIMSHFWDIYGFVENLTPISPLKVSSDRISIGYGPESLDKLQSISDLLVNLLEIFPEVCMIGGEAVEFLLQVKDHEGIAWQIIESIAAQTESQIKHKRASLLCKKCFNYCSSHKAKLYSSFSLISAKYYGCRICRQSRDLIEGRSIAILNNMMTEELSVRENEIFVNWLAYRKPLDFHEVRIVQVSDREVEEFAMQVGNDADEVCQSRYKRTPCTITSGCKLSENTLRILKHTFKSVKEM